LIAFRFPKTPVPASLPTPASKRQSTTRHLLLILAVAALSMAPTCGKRRPPLPPVERIPQRTESLSGAQRGNRVILIWPAPRRNAGEGSVQSIRRVDVYRVAEKPHAPLPMTEEEFAARATLIGSVSYDEIKKGGDSLTYTDTLELAGEPARLRYAVRYVNSAGQSAAFSNFFLMEPAAKVAEPPVVIKTGNELSETANTITWEPPRANTDGSTPVNLLGYNVYRATAPSTGSEQTPLNQEPITATQYQDKKFKFGEKYSYFVRSVSLGTEGKPVESLDSNSLPLAPVDKYRPAAPEHVQIGPAPGRLSIFWVANSEPDLAGYYLYRSTDPNLPKDKWKLLTPALYTKTTFADENVESGKTYYYYVIAVDNAGNQSEMSEVASDTVP
jgi:fibronectin type 3 domain-containing protein